MDTDGVTPELLLVRCVLYAYVLRPSASGTGPLPRYTQIWDIGPVLESLRKLSSSKLLKPQRFNTQLMYANGSCIGTECKPCSIVRCPALRVTTRTLFCLLKTCLQRAGVDTNISAKAELPVDQILARAGWSSEKTLRKFYRKPFENKRNFTKAVLQDSTLH